MSITPEKVAEFFTDADNDFHEGLDAWPSIRANGNVVEIRITPMDEEGDEDKANATNFRAVIVEGKTTPVLLAGPACVSGDGDGYLYLRCGRCDENIACIDAGNSLAGLNAEAADHTCPPLADQGEAETL